jgi:hypothetical protein
MTDFDLSRLAEIPDPLADRAARAPGRALEATAWPASPTRARVRSAQLAAFVSALLFNGAWLAFVEHRRDLGSIAAASVALGLGLPLVAAIAALVAGVRPGARGLGARVVEIAALVCLPPVLFAIGTLVTLPPAAGAGPFFGPALRCMGVSAILAADPFVVALLVMRRSFASAARWRTAAIGVACGGLAAATMSLACPSTEPLHVLVAHGAMMLVGGLAGALAGARVTRV